MLTEASQHEHGEDDAEDDGNSVAARAALRVASLRALPGGVTPAQYIPANLKHPLLQTFICNALAPFNADKGSATCMRYGGQNAWGMGWVKFR